MRLAEFIPAIVGEIEHERVVGHALFLELLHEFAAGLIEPFDHREVLGLFLVFDGGIFFKQPLRRIVRRVRQEGGVPNEERLFLFLSFVDEIVNRLHRFAADGQSLPAVPAGEAHVISEANPVRMAHPVFASVQSQITGLGEQSGQLRLFEKRLNPIGALLPTDGIVAGNAVLMRVQPGQHRCQRRTTDRGGYVSTGKGQAFGGEPVDVWGLGVGMTGKTVIGPRMIIADNQHDIGLFGLIRESRLPKAQDTHQK